MLPFSKYGLVWTGTRLGLLLALLAIGPAVIAHAMRPILPAVLIALSFFVMSFFAKHDHVQREVSEVKAQPLGQSRLSIRS